MAFLDPAPCSCLRGASAARPAALSLDTAAIVTGKSKSTLWRRVAAGDIARLVCHERRAMVALDDIAPLIPLALGDDDLALLVAADAGDVVAQCDMGHLFLAAAAPGVALHWLRLAAAQKCADAMQVLGCCHLHGWGVPRDENLGIVWIASAAALGHVIARRQMRALGVGIGAGAGAGVGAVDGGDATSVKPVPSLLPPLAAMRIGSRRAASTPPAEGTVSAPGLRRDAGGSERDELWRGRTLRA